MIKTDISIVKIKSLALLVLIGLLAFSGNTQGQTRKKVEILSCDLLDVNQQIVANAQRLLGNINIRVDGALMWCDSMYIYTKNSVDAFGNVHIVRGDTLNMYADFIHYDPATKLAKARRNVKLLDKQMTLTTDSLDYSMTNDMASYNYTGTVKDSTNVLTSVVGQYYVNEKKAYFKTNVDGVTKDYKIKSDTLIYFTNTRKVFIEGPTHIFNEKDTLYAEYGWYDSMKSYASLTKRPRIWNEKQDVKADSIFYDKQNGEGLAMGHARIQDIENSIIVVGNQVKYNDLTKIASATDSAMLIQYSKTDSLYLHADFLITMPDTTTAKKPVPNKKLPQKPIIKKAVSDSLSLAKTNATIPADQELNTDSITSGLMIADSLRTDTLDARQPKEARLVLAYHRVRFFRKDIQGKCDSLTYWSKDSTIQMFTQPIIWSDKKQISANYIEMINRAKDPDEIRMKDNAFIIAMEDDSIRFNQIKGKNMIGFVRENKIYKVDVSGNGQSNYYVPDKKGIIGMNKAESSNISIYMNGSKIKKIVFIKSPDGELKPLADLNDGDKLLPGFNWQPEIRPKDKEDIFRHPAQESSTDTDKKTKTPAIPDNKVKPVNPENVLAK